MIKTDLIHKLDETDKETVSYYLEPLKDIDVKNISEEDLIDILRKLGRTDFMKWYISNKRWYTDYEKYDEELKNTLDGINLGFTGLYVDFRKHIKLCNFLVPRLVRFKEITMGYPCDMTEDEWDRYIESTIEEVKQGCLDKFCERFNNFWW